MNPDILKTLGVSEDAIPDAIVKALVMYLAKTDEDKALATEVLKYLEAGTDAASIDPAADDTTAPAADTRADEVAEGMRKLAERIAQLESRSKPEHIAAAVRAEMSKAKPATTATTAPAKRTSSLGLRMFAGGNPAQAAGAPNIGPQSGSAAKKIFARVDAQLAGRSD